MYNNNNNNNNNDFLKAISDLEKEINFFENGISKAAEQNSIGEESQVHNIGRALDVQMNTAKSEDDDSQIRLQSELDNLSSAFVSLKSAVDDLKKQALTPPMQPDFSYDVEPNQEKHISNQINKLTNYMEQRFSDIEQNQQKIISSEKQNNVDNQNAKNMELEDNHDFSSASHSLEKFQQPQNNYRSINFPNTDGQIQKISSQYSNFISKMRNDCVMRIRNSIAVASEKIVRKEGFSLRKLSDVILTIVEQERNHFQSILQELNQRVLSTLDANFMVIDEEEQPVWQERNQANDHNESMQQKNLLDELEAIQTKIEDNLAQQSNFYAANKR